jgi:hypothetical protein
MGNPYLASDESIILATHNILIKSVRSDVILTNQRLIISDSSHAQFRPQTIPLAAVMTVTTGENGLGYPVITLSLAAAHDSTEPLELAFYQKVRQNRQQECNEWVQKLGELTILAREKAAHEGITLADLVAVITSEKTAQADMGDAENTMVRIEPATPRPSAPGRPYTFSRPAPGISKFVAIAAIIIVILAVAGGVYLVTKSVPGKTTVPVVPDTTTIEVTRVPSMSTTVPTLTTTEPVSLVTPAPTLSSPMTTQPAAAAQLIIPETGVWVRVTNPGNYTGSIGTAGNLRDIVGTGVQFYQIPAAPDAMIDVIIQKESGAGDMLSADIYNTGVLVKHGSTTTPKGTLEIHISLKPATPAMNGS